MKRTFCVLTTALLKDHSFTMAASNEVVNLVANFKDWKFTEPPSYSKLPIDENPEYDVPTAVKNAVFSKVPTDPITGNLRLVCASEDVMKDILDLDPSVAETKEFIDFVAGKLLPEGGLTVSHRYGGYQFGYWADQLGDGRAHILGEYVNKKGESWQLQLKGSGETPYSRFGDGRAVLRSSIREMIASEACHGLGMPTTRAAALVASDDATVWRDPLYCGRQEQERAAIVLRVAPCWYRLGSVEILHKMKEFTLMKQLVDFIIEHHFPEIDAADEDKYVKWYWEVASRNLDLVAQWQGFGFTHGVINTDNISILGLTIDYGPFAFMEHYYEHYVSNTSDDTARYTFRRQPEAFVWSLVKFAEALEPLFTQEQKIQMEDLEYTLEDYMKRKIRETYLLKLGLQVQFDGDDKLIADLLKMMQSRTADYTGTFRQLGEVDPRQLTDRSVTDEKWALKKLSTAEEKWDTWVEAYCERVESEELTEEWRRAIMNRVNPIYVPRTWMLHKAITDARENDFEKVRFLLQVMRNPYERNEEADRRGYSSKPPSWSYTLKLSCSS